MSALFPDPYPDELLYSALARYQDMMGIAAGRAVLRTFFGMETGRAVFDLPGRLDALLSSLPPGHQYTAERLLYEHTVLPYYAPFLPPERVNRAEHVMRQGNGSTIYGLLGLRASRISVAQPFRFCPDCVKRDRVAYGVGYWNRAHQLPGIWVCAFHGTVLREYRTLPPFPPYDFISLSRLQRLGFQTTPATSSNKNRQVLQVLAEETHRLLMIRVPPEGLSYLHDRYRHFLHQNDWMQTATRIRMTDVRHAFCAHFGNALLEKLGCTLPQDKDGWFERLLRKPRTASHPLHHLLVLQFLGISILGFLRPGESSPAPFPGSSGAGREENNSEQSSSGPKTHDPDWENRLIALAEQTDCSLRSIAEELSVDPKTVQRHARRLGVWRSEWTTWDKVAPATKRTDETAERRKRYRSQWCSLQERYPKAGTSALRQRASAAYAFLYRSDREWLDAHKPSPQIPRAQSSRVDWPKRDREFQRQAAEVVETLRQGSGRPVWIRRSTVLKRMGRTSEFFSNRDRLPKTRAFLGEVSETRLEFAQKKIEWVALDFISRKICPKPWELVREAALRPDLASSLSEEITQVVSKIESTLRPHIA